MLAFEQFRHCPRCGDQWLLPANPIHCASCDFTYFVNATVAAAAFVFDAEGRVILIRRAKEPKMGMLTVPGGFLDIGETAEVGLAREVMEEVGLEIENVKYLCSEPNLYFFKEVTYPVCDLIFTADAVDASKAAALDGATHHFWMSLSEVPMEEIAFPSVRKALAMLQNSR